MFQFTHPGKGATNRTLPKEEVLRVSIHAPWEGCDSTGSTRREQEVRFQFTHPGKGATHVAYEDNDLTYVSIHAPWEGCD